MYCFQYVVPNSFISFPQDRKRSLRSSPARSKRVLDAVAALSSDDEGVVTTAESSRKKQTIRKSLGRPARAVAKQQQNKPALSSPIPSGMYGREYHLRSKNTKQISVSSDEESSPVVTHKTKGTSSTGDAGMSLTESNFRREITNVNKGSTSKKATSTPQTKPSTKQSPVIKTKLKFDSSQLRRSVRNRGPALTIEQVTGDEKQSKHQDKNLSVIAEAEEEDHSKEERETLVAEGNNDNYPAWPPVGWKEFALAAFVTGLAAVGYVCYTTDYFKYC